MVNADVIDRLKADLKAEAARLGFAACGIAPAADDPLLGERLDEWLAAGLHGEMEWMETRAHHRRGPQALWPEARSVIALGMSYAPAADPLALAEHPDRARISVYAQGADYHDTVKKALKALARWLVEEARKRGLGERQVKVFVDTAPVPEKPLAAAAGLGWQGKHTNLVSREFGSWLFLGSVLTTLDLDPDPPADPHCGACRACLDVCPTGAFPAPFQLDARACLSYLTIEHRGPIPHRYREAMGNRIYGCDDCLAVCPWNKFASTARESAFHARESLKAPRLEDLALLDDAGFRALFAKSPVKRIGRDRFIRNVLYAIGNSGDAGLLRVVEPLLTDQAEEVRDAAEWATERLRGVRPA